MTPTAYQRLVEFYKPSATAGGSEVAVRGPSIAAVVAARWRVVAVCAVAGLALAFGASLFQEKRYPKHLSLELSSAEERPSQLRLLKSASVLSGAAKTSGY